MPYPMFPDNAFPLGRTEPCFCSSGERFKHCCGNRSEQRQPPSGLSIVDKFISSAQCDELVELANTMQGNRFTVTDAKGNSTLDQQRMTEWVDLRESQQQLLDDLIARALVEHIIPSTGQDIAWYEQPQLLRYAAGDYYMHHSDAYQFVPEQQAWKKVVDRDISILIYVNDGYQGGEVNFKRFFYNLKPKKGMLVWFPSDVRYEHMAMPVTSGRRYALVSWAASAAVERVQAKRAKRAILWPSKFASSTNN